MSKRIALLCAFAAAALTAACGQPQQEEIVFIDQPVVAEPVYNKY